MHKKEQGDKMGVLSVSVPDELKKKISELDEINWSAVARKAFEAKIKQAEMLERITKKSNKKNK